MGKFVVYMLAVFSALAIITRAVATPTPSKEHKKSLWEKINSEQNAWKAGDSHISRLSDEDFRKLLGEADDSNAAKVNLKDVIPSNDIPDFFDAREKWSDCPSIWSIKNQGNCGGCWAVAGSSVASDRLCIGSNYAVKVNLSAENLMSCCPYCAPKGGCNGGASIWGWKYMTNTGIVTGGDYNSNEGCQPYAIDVQHANDYYTPPCSNNCTNQNYDKSYSNDIHTGDSYSTLPKDIAKIQTELMTYGSLHASFDVYADWQGYIGGVYYRKSNDKKGRHAVRVLGWGYDDDSDLDYWFIANSFGRDWGENGYFRMVRGINNCGIEESMISGFFSS